MVVRTAGHNIEASIDKSLRHSSCISDYLRLINLEVFTHCLFKAHRLRCNDMHQWPTLALWEYCKVEFFLQFRIRFSKNYSAARSAQSFVGSRCSNISNVYRAWIDAGRDQPRDMSHVDHEVSTDAIRYIAEFLPINNTRKCGKPCHDHLRLMLLSKRAHLLIVDVAGFTMQTVLHCIVDSS